MDNAIDERPASSPPYKLQTTIARWKHDEGARETQESAVARIQAVNATVKLSTLEMSLIVGQPIAF
jgi:hypothetical protein